MSRASSLPIIRSFVMYIRHWQVSCRFLITASKQSQVEMRSSTCVVATLASTVVLVHVMKAQRRSKGSAPFNLELIARWIRLVNFTRLPLYPREIVPRIHCTEDCVGPRVALNVWQHRMYLTSAEIRTSDRSARSPVAIPTTLPWSLIWPKYDHKF